MILSPSDAVLLDIRAIIKAETTADGRRLVSVEASSEDVDSQGDVVLQSALLNSSASFIASGHLDIDHISELGDRLGIPNPLSYIVGQPLEVRDLGGGRTEVLGEISRHPDGSHDPNTRQYDAFWESLQAVPSVRWRASIFGYPIAEMVEDCQNKACSTGATRFVIKGIDWRSLAFTRNPINTSLNGFAKIISAKSHVEALIKSRVLYKQTQTLAPGSADGVAAIPDNVPPMHNASSVPVVPTLGQRIPMDLPKGMDELVGQHERHIASGDCPHGDTFPSTMGFSRHFSECCGADPQVAEIHARALMHYLLTR